MIITKNCPCFSGKTYETCCQALHQGTPAASALELMRSRYAAYALNLADYIMDTTHPQNSGYETDREKWRAGIEHFSKTFTFDGLEIGEFTEKGNHAVVEFTAHLHEKGSVADFTEKSTFEKVKGRWLYKDKL